MSLTLHAKFYLLGVQMGTVAEREADAYTARRAEACSREGIDGHPFGRNEAECDLRVNARRKVAVSCITLARRWRWTPEEVRAFVEELEHNVCVTDDGEPRLFEVPS